MPRHKRADEAGSARRTLAIRFAVALWAQQAERLPKLLAPGPIPRTPNEIERVNQPLPEKELKALRDCVQRGRPFGDEAWTEVVACMTK